MVVTSPSKKRNNSDLQEFFDSALTGFGLGTKDIESTQGRLTLHGFHPLFYKRAKAIISSDRKRAERNCMQNL